MPAPQDLAGVLPLIETLVLESDPIARERILFEAVWAAGVAQALAAWREEPGPGGRIRWQALCSRGALQELPHPPDWDGQLAALPSGQRLWLVGIPGARYGLALGGVHASEAELEALEALVNLIAVLAGTDPTQPAPPSLLPLNPKARVTLEAGQVQRLDHDLRNLLACIRTQQELLEDLGPALGQKERERREENLQREFKRAGEFLLTPHPEQQVSARALGVVLETVEAERARFENEGLRLMLQLGPGVEQAAVALSEHELARLVRNLLTNAREACSGLAPPLGQLWDVRCRLSMLARGESRWLLIEVKDHGRGWPEGRLADLFQPGVSRAKLGGRGLGLAVVRELAERGGGKVLACRTKTRGACVRVELLVGIL